MAPSLQLQLPTRDPRVVLPMVDLPGAFAILGDASETDLVALAESGCLWAWNIAHPNTISNEGRIEYRFLAKSVSALKSVWREILDRPNRVPETFEEVLRLVLPRHNKPFFSALECKRALNCRRQHFLNLLVAHAFSGTTFRQGPGGSPAIDRASFIAFLRDRCIGGVL